MVRDYELVYNPETGNMEAVEGEGNPIYNRIYTAINLRKGTLICNPQYGSDLHKVEKAVQANETLVKTYVKDALKPLSNVVENLQVSDVNIDTRTGKATFSVRGVANCEIFSFNYWVEL
jgi:phage gp46-like protein